MASDDSQIDGVPGLRVMLDGDAVNRYVAEAVLKSALGQQLQQAVEALLDKKDGYFSTRGNVVKNIVEAELKGLVRDRLTGDEQIQAMLNATLKEVITERMTKEAVGRIVNRVFEDRW